MSDTEEFDIEKLSEDEALLHILHKRTIVKVMGDKVVLDPQRYQFNEASLTPFIEKEASWYDHYGQMLANAEAELQFRELKHEALFFGRVVKAKEEESSSDKLAEAKAKSDPDIVKAKEAIISSKRTVKILQQHLRSWDKAHENAQSRGHMLRKEIDKMNAEIYGQKGPSSVMMPEGDLDALLGNSVG